MELEIHIFGQESRFIMVNFVLFWGMSGTPLPPKSGGFAPRPLWQCARLHLQMNFFIVDLKDLTFQGLDFLSNNF